jgi:hypothetical protein
MKVGQIVTFTLPSSKKKTAGKILEVRDKSVLVQTKDSKKLIPKNFLKKKMTEKKGPPKITGEQMRSIKIIEPPSQGIKKKVEPKKEPKKKANKTYLVKVDGEKDRKLTLSLLKQFINKRFGKKLSPDQQRKIKFMAEVTIPGKKVGHFIIDGDLIYTSKSRVSEINNQIVGKVDMGEKRKITLSEEQKKDKQLQKEKEQKEEDQKVKEHNEKYGKMEDLEDLWKKLKDLKWSAYDRKEIDYYIDNPDLDGPAYNSTNNPPGDVKAEVIQKGKRPVIKVLRVYYSKLTATTARPGKFKKEDFEFPEEEKKEPPKAKKKGKTKKEEEERKKRGDEQTSFVRELRKRGLSQEEMMKEFKKKFG